MTQTTPAQLLSRMGDLEHQTPDKDFIGMFYGPSGAGKTTFVVGLAQALTKSGRILYLDSSDGWVSLQNFPGLTSGVTRIRYGGYDDLAGIADALRKKAKGFTDFDVIVVDEMSSIAEETLDEVILDKYGDKTAEPEGKDYRPMGQLIMAALNTLHGVEGLHVILVAHDREEVDHRKVKIVMPGFPPKLRKGIQKLMHVIGYVSATVTGSEKNTEYLHTIQCQPTKLVEAKSRIGGMPLLTAFDSAVDVVSEWVSGDTFVDDTTSPEVFIEPEEDALPVEGVPLSDSYEDDDEPAFVESV